MYPLLVSGLSSLATNLLDRWQSAGPAKTAASEASTAQFGRLLQNAQRSSAANKPTFALATDLLSGPELSTSFKWPRTKGPMRVGIETDGSLSILHPDGTSEPMATTSATQETAGALRVRLLKEGTVTLPNATGGVQFSAI